MQRTEKAASQSLIYAFGIFLQHAASIIMLPIYTRYLTPADYGIADLLSMGVEVVGLIVGVISAEAIFRFFYERNDENYRHSVVFTVYAVSLLVNLVGYFLIMSFSDMAAGYLFAGFDIQNPQFLVLLFGATILFQVMSAIPMAFIRAQQKPVLYVTFSALRLSLAVSFNLYFVVYKGLHITGVVYATFCFTAVHGVALTVYMLVHTRVAFSFDIARKSLSFSWPLMLSSLALFLTTYGDRLFIKYFYGASEVGLYSLAYKFGFILVSVGWASFAQAWDVRRYEVVHQDDAIDVFRRVFLYTQMIVFLVALVLSLFSKELLLVMAAPEFHEAHKVVGLIVLAYIFNIWSHYCMFGILYSKKTIYKALVDAFILPFTFVLYYVLISPYGAIGAGWATLISLLVRFLLINYFSTPLYDMNLEWRRIVPALILSILLYLAGVVIELPIIQSILYKVALLLVFIAYAFFIGFRSEDRVSMINFCRYHWLRITSR